MNSVKRTCLVDIVTEGPGLLLPDTTGLSIPIQAARVVVTLGGESRSHVIVRAAASPWQLPPDDGIFKLFPTEFVSSVREDVDGGTTLSCASADELTLLSAASAAATLKRSWGWDESAKIVVKFTSGASFAVDPVFDGRAWNVIGRTGV